MLSPLRKKFRLLTESFDASGPAGHMMMHMLGSFAEFEREIDPRANPRRPTGSANPGPRSPGPR